MLNPCDREVTEYQQSAVNKKHIAFSILHNVKTGKDKLIEYGSNPSNPNRETIPVLLKGNQFLYAHAFELLIKGIWELLYSKVFGRQEVHEYKHDIYRIYLTLDSGTKNWIQGKYDSIVEEYRNNFGDSSVVGPSNVGRLMSSFPYYSFEECLKMNEKLVIHGKYEFQEEGKINIVTGIFPIVSDDVDCLMIDMSNPELLYNKFLYNTIEYMESIL